MAGQLKKQRGLCVYIVVIYLIIFYSHIYADLK